MKVFQSKIHHRKQHLGITAAFSQLFPDSWSLSFFFKVKYYPVFGLQRDELYFLTYTRYFKKLILGIGRSTV
jgi:hypothetical protein